MTRIKLLEILAAVLIVSGVAALIYLWTASPLGTSDKVGLTMAISTVALVIVTSIYAWHTRKMAEEMREQRLQAYKPHIVLEITGPSPNDVFLRYNFFIRLSNEGPGTSIELCLSASHPNLKFSSFRHVFKMSSGDRPLDNVPLEVKTIDDKGTVKNILTSKTPAIEFFVNYRDILGNWWHSTLEVVLNREQTMFSPVASAVGVSGKVQFGGNSE